jgi:hypothetical protein
MTARRAYIDDDLEPEPVRLAMPYGLVCLVYLRTKRRPKAKPTAPSAPTEADPWAECPWEDSPLYDPDAAREALARLTPAQRAAMGLPADTQETS